MNSKPNSRDIKIPGPVKDFAKVEFNKKFKKKYKGYYDSKKDLRDGYYKGLLDLLPDAIAFVFKNGHIQTKEVQKTKAQIFGKICDQTFVKFIKKALKRDEEIDNIELMPILIAEILQAANEQNAELLKNDPDAKVYDMSDLAELSKMILKKKLKKMKKAGIPEDMAFDILSIIPCEKALGRSHFFRIRVFYDTLYEHAKTKDIPLDEIMDVIVPKELYHKFIVFALLERKEKFSKLSDKQKELYISISTWCFHTMEEELSNGEVRAIIGQYIDIRRKDEASGRDSNRRYALSSLAESEYKKILDIVRSIIAEDASAKKYL